MISLPIDELPLIELKGDFQEMGLQFGQQCQQPIQELYQIRLSAAIKQAEENGRNLNEEQALSLAGSGLSILRNFDQDTFEETLGIALGSGLSLEQIFLMQGLTDLRDYFSWGKLPDGFGCTALTISRERSSNGKLLIAQNWDLGADNMPYVCMVKRTPTKGPVSYNLTVTGGLSMIGLNDRGLAIGTTNIKTIDSRPGVHYLNILHKMMKCNSTDEAADIVKYAIRGGAHYYMIGDKLGNFRSIECSALNEREISAQNGIITHCNHPLHPEIQELQADVSGSSTCHRQLRVDELTQKGVFDLSSLKKILSDHANGENAICRHSEGQGVSTNATVIISPETGEIHACRSQPHLGKWQTFNFN